METAAAAVVAEAATAEMAAVIATEASIVAGADAMLYSAGWMTEAQIGASIYSSAAIPSSSGLSWLNSAGSFLKANSGTISLAGSGISAGGAIMGGISQSKALAFERAQMEAQAEQTRLAAAIDETNRLSRLGSTLAAQRAMAIGKGYSDDSPDLEAIMEDTEDQAMADIGVARFNIGARGQNYRLGARQTEFMASSAMSRGFVGAGSSLFNYAAKP